MFWWPVAESNHGNADFQSKRTAIRISTLSIPASTNVNWDCIENALRQAATQRIVEGNSFFIERSRQETISFVSGDEKFESMLLRLSGILLGQASQNQKKLQFVTIFQLQSQNFLVNLYVEASEIS